LRADVYWAKQDWLATATVLARMLRDRDPDAESLAAEEVEQLMKMAVALALTNNRPALAELRAKYGSMMDQTANGQAFRAISSYVDGGPIDVTNMSSTVAEIDTYEAYMASLRERVAGDSLSSVN
jgi:hypothetical protein